MITPDNLEQLTALANDEDAYAIMAGLRGPDADVPDAERLKGLTSAVIRHLTGCRLRTQIWIQTPAEARARWDLYSEAVKESIRALWKRETHFFWHVIRALDALGSPEALEYRNWLVDAMRRSS